MKKIVLFILVSLFIFACQKDKGTIKNWGTILAPQDIKDYTFFRPGTYWIYQDTVSMVFDSVYVTAIEEGYDEVTEDMGKSYTGSFQHYTITMKCTADTFTYYNYFNGFYFIFGSGYPVFRYRTNTNVGLGKTILMTRNFQAGATFINDNYGKCVVEGLWPNIVCGDSTYTNVLQIMDAKNVTENQDSTRFYHVANKGIVKKRIYNQNKNWVLLRYNIVQ